MSNNRGRDKFKKFKFILHLLTQIILIFPISIRKWMLSVFRNTNGLIGVGIRYILIKSISQKCGDNVLIHPGVYIFSPEKLSLGNNISIHPMCYIDATGEISIGNDVSIAHGTTILSTTHSYSEKNMPIRDQTLRFAPTTIMNNVWIGCKSTILLGIIVNEGAIIGANSIVTKNVENNAIVVGNPGRLIKYR